MTQSVDPGGLNNCRQQIRSFYMHSSNSYPKPAVTLLFESLKGQGKSNQCSIICNRDHTGQRFQKYSQHFMRLQIVFRSKSENDKEWIHFIISNKTDQRLPPKKTTRLACGGVSAGDGWSLMFASFDQAWNKIKLGVQVAQVHHSVNRVRGIHFIFQQLTVFKRENWFFPGVMPFLTAGSLGLMYHCFARIALASYLKYTLTKTT